MGGTRTNGVGVLVVALLAASRVATAPPTAAAGDRIPKRGVSYLPGTFEQSTVDRVVTDLARVGIGVYEPGTAKPRARLRKPVSPMRLTVEQAQLREPIRQSLEGDSRLELAERSAEAIVDALAEGQRLRRVRASQIERLGLREN